MPAEQGREAVIVISSSVLKGLGVKALWLLSEATVFLVAYNRVVVNLSVSVLMPSLGNVTTVLQAIFINTALLMANRVS